MENYMDEKAYKCQFVSVGLIQKFPIRKIIHTIILPSCMMDEVKQKKASL